MGIFKVKISSFRKRDDRRELRIACSYNIPAAIQAHHMIKCASLRIL